MNSYAHKLFQENKSFGKKIKQIAQRRFRQYKGEYQRQNLFEVDDLEQEIWAELFESNLIKRDDFLFEAERICDKLRKRGGRRPVEIPISQLNKKERADINNLFYGTGSLEDDYSEESNP